MITLDKVIEIFCVADEFCKKIEVELDKNLQIAPFKEGKKRRRNRKGAMSKSEIMAILSRTHVRLYSQTISDLRSYDKNRLCAEK
ncbi:MAG: transposase [Phocaeicola sp.]|nr:transposase [Phocaeicola sp.]